MQLAVLAHIRHNHTRYDQLLKETSYVNARKAVESLCLDFLVKWRGDEETGRDQLDEILCEVIVISDSDSDDSNEEDDEDESSDASSSTYETPGKSLITEGETGRATPSPLEPSAPLNANNSRGVRPPRATHAPQGIKKVSRRDRRDAKWAQRGFGRYQAARDQAWHQAVERQRLGTDRPVQPTRPLSVDRSANHGPQQWQFTEPDGSTAVRARPEPRPHVQHVSYGAALPSIDMRYERGSAPSRVNDLQQTIPPVGYRIPQEACVQGDSPRKGFGPIDGPRPLPYGSREVERVSHHGQDLKDHLVPSIEPASPELSNFPHRFPISHRQHASFADAAVGPEREVAIPRGPPVPSSGVAMAQDFHTICAEEGFVRLPPRSDPSRMPAAHDPLSEPFILVSSRPLSTARVDDPPPTSGGFGARHMPTHYDRAVPHDDGPIPKSGSRPVWISDDGVVLRSESRPILIQDHPVPFRPSHTEPVYRASQHNRPSPTKRAVDVRQAGHRWIEDNDRQYADSRTDRRIDTLQDDFVEIVRVSNKFPRRYEPHAAPAGAGTYDSRPAAPYRSASQQVNDGVALREIRHFSPQVQQFERQAGRPERPEFGQRNIPFAARQPERHTNDFQREERVVGIEYIPTRPR